VIVLTRRLLALANPPGCTTPVASVDLDHPMGHDPLALPSTNHNGKRDGAGVASTSVAPVAAGPADPHGRANGRPRVGEPACRTRCGSPALPLWCFEANRCLLPPRPHPLHPRPCQGRSWRLARRASRRHARTS